MDLFVDGGVVDGFDETFVQPPVRVYLWTIMTLNKPLNQTLPLGIPQWRRKGCKTIYLNVLRDIACVEGQQALHDRHCALLLKIR